MESGGPFGHVWALLWMCSREEEQGKETGESEVTLCVCGWSRAGWAGQGSRKAFAHLQGFLLSLLVQAGADFHVSYFGFLLCRVGMSFLQRAENGQGREGSLALENQSE